MQLNSNVPDKSAMQENMSDYVAQLQLHMSLQAKNLVPSLSQSTGEHQGPLEQTQADFEKYVSRKNLKF